MDALGKDWHLECHTVAFMMNVTHVFDGDISVEERVAMTLISPEPWAHHANLPRPHSLSDKHMNWLTWTFYFIPSPIYDDKLQHMIESANTIPSCSCYVGYIRISLLGELFGA